MIHTSNFGVDGYPSKEDLFGQISLSMNAMYFFCLRWSINLGMIIESGINFCKTILRFNELII